MRWENKFAAGDLVIPGYQTGPGPGGYPWFATATFYAPRPVLSDPGQGWRDLGYPESFGRREYQNTVPLYGNQHSVCYTMQQFNNGFQIETRAARTACPWEVSSRFP